MYFSCLEKQKQSFFNMNSFYFIFNMMNKLDIKKLYFNGGAILNQPKLKKLYEIDDWDIHLIQDEEGTNEVFNKLKILSDKTGGFERGSTASTLKSLVFNYLDKKIDFQIKKRFYLTEENCTFNIDSLNTILKKNENDFYIQNPQVLDTINTGIVTLQAKQSDIYRILRRLIIIIAKFDIKKFIIEKNLEIIINTDNSKIIDKILAQEKRENFDILKKQKKTKASCLIKFLCMCYRVKNLYEYILKIINSHLFDKIFPELCKSLENKELLNKFKKESELDENKRKINSQNDIVELIINYNNNDKKLANEFLINLKNSEFNEVNLKNLENIIDQ